MNKNGQPKRISKIGTWNVSGLGDKEPCIVEFCRERKIEILGISDIRKKGHTTKEIHDNYVLICSGTNTNERAKHGVGFIVSPVTSKNITNTEYISERIALIRTAEKNKTTVYIQIYAPCNDSYKYEEKVAFFEELSDTINKVKDTEDLIVMGDFNGRVGKRRTPWEEHLGPYSDQETQCNENGELLLGLCAEHDLIITNTWFQHRKSHIKTWYKWNNLDQASQIDFILTRRTTRKTVRDARAIPNYVIDTDHRPVIMNQLQTGKDRKTRTYGERITNLRKLANKEIAEQVEKDIQEALETLPEDTAPIEEEWQAFKNKITETLKERCGTKKTGTRRKRGTMWWNEKVKDAVAVKKKLFKEWKKSKKEDDYITYRKARRDAKRVIETAKKESWNQYGEHLTRICKETPREFYKSVKSMRVRNEEFHPTSIINDKDGKPIFCKDKIKERWGEYFKELLNPHQDDEPTSNFTRKNEEIEEEPPILPSEVEATIKKSPRNKSAGIDGITTEAIQACGDAGIRWITRIFNVAWKTNRTPEDWQSAIIVPIWKNKGNKRDCNTYRGISLLSHAGKMYAKILEQRIRPQLEAQLS